MGIDLVARLLVLSGTLCAVEAKIGPLECYTCQSPIESKVCGEGFTFPNFMQKYCTVNHHYCLKVIEKAGRIPLVYRKCSSTNCEQEAEIRHGEILACSVCTTTLCNCSTVCSTVSSLMIITAILFYHLNIISILDFS